MRLRRRRLLPTTEEQEPKKPQLTVVQQSPVEPEDSTRVEEAHTEPAPAQVVRRRVEAPREDALEALERPKRRRAPEGTVRTKALSEFEKAVLDARARWLSKEEDPWGTAQAGTFVGVYAVCHEKVYGVLPEELRELSTFRMAHAAAKKMLLDDFGDDPEDFLVFIRWCWVDEKRQYEKAMARDEAGLRRRIGWRLQFSSTKLVDFKVFLETQARKQQR